MDTPLQKVPPEARLDELLSSALKKTKQVASVIHKEASKILIPYQSKNSLSPIADPHPLESNLHRLLQRLRTPLSELQRLCGMLKPYEAQLSYTAHQAIRCLAIYSDESGETHLEKDLRAVHAPERVVFFRESLWKLARDLERFLAKIPPPGLTDELTDHTECSVDQDSGLRIDEISALEITKVIGVPPSTLQRWTSKAESPLKVKWRTKARVRVFRREDADPFLSHWKKLRSN